MSVAIDTGPNDGEEEKVHGVKIRHLFRQLGTPISYFQRF